MNLTALVAQPGPNDLDFDDPALPGRRIVLRSARPQRFSPQTPVVFVHHGVNRNGGDYRDYWLPLVDAADVLVVAPEFPTEGYPGSAWYNFGNLFDEEGNARPRSHSTYGLDGRVFAMLQQQGVTAVDSFAMFGHSAGGQYVHRAVSLGFTQHVRVAVTANAGTYAMPDLSIPFPFGLGAVGLSGLDALLAFPLIVMAGTADIDSDSPNFPKDPAALAQGPTRHARAHRYHKAGHAHAACAWRLIDVPGVAHDGERMSAAAAPVLAGLLHSQPD